MDPSRTIEEPPSDLKEPEGKTEQVNTLLQAAFRVSRALVAIYSHCTAPDVAGVNGCESHTHYSFVNVHVCVLISRKDVSTCVLE